MPHEGWSNIVHQQHQMNNIQRNIFVTHSTQEITMSMATGSYVTPQQHPYNDLHWDLQVLHTKPAEAEKQRQNDKIEQLQRQCDDAKVEARKARHHQELQQLSQPVQYSIKKNKLFQPLTLLFLNVISIKTTT